MLPKPTTVPLEPPPVTHYSKTKFMAGFNYGSRVSRGLAPEIKPIHLMDRTAEFRAGYTAGKIDGPSILDDIEANNRIQKSWEAYSGPTGGLILQ